MKYSVNGRQPENNFLWDKSTILSMRSAKNHNVINKHRYIVNLFESSDTTGIQELNSCGPEFAMHFETISSDIAGIQDSQSYRPGYTITAEATTSVITGKLDSQSYLPVRNIASESQKT